MSADGRWEEGMWDRLPHMITYTRSNIEWLNKHVKLTLGLHKLHKEYSKGLAKLVKSHRDKEVEVGMLGDCWEGVMRHLGSVAARHKQLAIILDDVGSQYQEEADLLSQEQRNLELNSKKVQAGLEANVQLLEKFKERYHKKQLEADKAEEIISRSEDDMSVEKGELERLRETADDKKNKASKAREEYRSQLIDTNRKQREFYQESWPSILSGMRSIVERTGESVVNLVSRLDQAGRDEWGDLESVATAVNMEEDFAAFLSWASSGNLPPPDFMFQEPSPGSSSLSRMGTLRRSFSRSKPGVGLGSPVARPGGSFRSSRLGSRFSLKSPAATKHSSRLRFSSVKEEGRQLTSSSSSIQHLEAVDDLPNRDQQVSSEPANPTQVNGHDQLTANGAEEEHEEEVEADRDQIVNGKEEVDTSMEAEDRNSLEDVSLQTDLPRETEAVTEMSSAPGEPVILPVPAARKKPIKLPSYDDRLNPFTNEFRD